MRKTEKTCQTCGAAFIGGATAQYCPSCKKIRYLASMARHRQRVEDGTVRRVGYKSACARCGAPYIVNSGRQKFCGACAEKNKNEKGRQHYENNKAEILARQKAAKGEWKGTEKTCVVCGRAFVRKYAHRFCSPECARLHANKQLRERKAAKTRKRGVSIN